MPTLRSALLRLPRSLTLNPARAPPQSLPRIHLGSISRFSSDGGSLDVDLSNEESKRRLFNRLLYRSRQRGFLELDLVLGNYVEENIHSMDELRIRALVDVLDLYGRTEIDEENPDLWKWLTGQEKPPEPVTCNPIFTVIQSKIMENLNKHAAPETRSSPGQPWVRGWDDKRGPDGGPNYGNQ